ncbi:hypothetical protein KR009_004428, partial [Drosophila setifemur]
YTVVGPGTISSNRDYIVSVGVHDTKEPVTVKIGIIGASYNGSQMVDLERNHDLKEITFKLPVIAEGAYNLTAEGVSGLKFHDSIPLYWRAATPIIFMQADKDIYRPGDTVHFRALVLDEQLRPFRNADDMVFSIGPSVRVIADKVRNNRITNGVFAGQFPLSKNAPLGQWSIQIEDSSGEEYGLDGNTFTLFDLVKEEQEKFTIRIDVPGNISIKADKLEIVVTARYISDSYVHGKTILNVAIFNDTEINNKKVIHTITDSGVLTKGQSKFTIQMSDIARHLPSRKSHYTVEITANVTDCLIGGKSTKKRTIHLVPNSHIVACDGFSCYRPWKAKDHKVSISILNLDGSLVNDSEAEVKLKYTIGDYKFVNRFGIENQTYIFKGDLNRSGLYVFTANLPDLPDNYNVDYNISVEYLGEEYSLRNTWLKWFIDMVEVHNAFFTPMPALNFFLKVHGPRNSDGSLTPLVIGGEYQVTLSSIRPFKYFIYTIVGRGLILHTERVQFPEPKMAHNFTLKVTDLNSPRLYIYAYYIDKDGVIQHTETNYIVILDLPIDISITAPESGYPGEPIELQIETEPHSYIDHKPSALRDSKSIKFNDVGSVDTWIFSNITQTESEVTKFVHDLPDTLGSWVISGFSLHPEKGLGLFQSNRSIKIKTVRPYSLSIRLPHSVKLGEIVRVPAVIINHLPNLLKVEVTLDNSDDQYDFLDIHNSAMGEQNSTQNLLVKEYESESAVFLIRPKFLGDLQLKFITTSSSGDRIASQAAFKVNPVGITEYRNHAFFINLKDSKEYKSSVELHIPEDIVLNTDHVHFGLTADLLSPVLDNIERLFPLSTGEQVMSYMVVNLLLWDYLKSINKLSPSLDVRIRNNLRDGYQNIMQYRNEDGSFTWFDWKEDAPPRNGSTWLTAYALRYFNRISKLIFVDDSVVQKGFDFLTSHQMESGRFKECDELNEGSSNSLTLTSHALLALLEARNRHQEAIDKAVIYIRSQEQKELSQELLTKTISIYALKSSNLPEAGKLADQLQSLASYEGDRSWWADGRHDVEITSYALLLLLESNEKSSDTVLSTVRWLVAQRNSFGGFASSQDTVVGLTALIKFAEKSGYEAAKWEVTVSNKGKREKTEKLSTSEENDLLLQTVEFPQGTKSLTFEAKGTGAALIQISYQYNVVEKEPKPSFKVETIVLPETSPAKLELSVCVDFVEEGKALASNMAILEVSLPSGYTADEESFKDIREIERVRVCHAKFSDYFRLVPEITFNNFVPQLVETKNGDSVVVVYFENLAKSQTKCIPIEAYKTHAVANQKPSSVILYDYYDTNKKATEYYSIDSKLCDICK